MTNMNELMNFEIPSNNSKKIQREEMAKMALANERQILKKGSIKVRKPNTINDSLSWKNISRIFIKSDHEND